MTYDGSSWSTPVSLDSTGNVGADSSLAIDSNDNLHVTYVEGDWHRSTLLRTRPMMALLGATPVSLDSTGNGGLGLLISD